MDQFGNLCCIVRLSKRGRLERKKKFRSEMRPTMLDLRRLEVEVEVLKTRPSLFFICRMDLNFTSFCRRKESEAWKAWEGKGNMK